MSGDDTEVRGGVEEEAAHDFGEDALGETGEASVVEQDGAVGVFVVEEVVREQLIAVSGPGRGRFG